MSESKVIFEIDQKILGNIRKTFGDKSKVEIGLLQTQGEEGVKALTHEFGNYIPVTAAMSGFFHQRFGFRLKTGEIVIPERSFLRKTASQRSEAFMAQLSATSDAILYRIVEGDWRVVLTQMGETWADFIRECFQTRGFGQWPKLSPVTIMGKGHDTPLYETGELERSIGSQVVSND